MNGTADHLSNSGKGVVESHGRLRVDRRKRRLFLSLFSGTVRPDSRHPSGLQHSFTSSYIVDSHSRTIREEAPVKYPKHKQIRFGSRFFLYRFLCPRNTIYNAGMALVRRSALPAGDNYTQYRYCGDWLFWIQIVSGGGNVVYLAEPLNYYRVHDSNTTAESIATGRKHIETLRILEETFRLIDPPLICRLSIAGKHLLRIRKAAGSHWNEEPYLSVRLAWRERYRHPRMIMFWHKVFKDLPRSFAR